MKIRIDDDYEAGIYETTSGGSEVEITEEQYQAWQKAIADYEYWQDYLRNLLKVVKREELTNLYKKN